ncbi:unnamed protein product [Alopecurus aequalis]
MEASPSYDTVLQIMERVKDVVTLFRCAMACKGWRRLIMADPSFIRRCLPEEVCRLAPFPGFFAQLRPRRGSPTPCLIPAPRPVLGSYRRPLRSFIPNLADPGFFDHGVPLVSRHGLLLVRLADVDPHPTSDDLLAVCNLLTGTLDVLPRLKHDRAVHGHHMTGYAILTDGDYSSSDDKQGHPLPSFKVLVVGISQSTLRYRLRTFSSAGEPRWNTCFGIVDGGRIDSPFMQHNAVVCGGMARWLFQGKSSYRSGDVFFTKLSVTHDQLMNGLKYEESYFSADTEGRLRMIYLQKQGRQLNILTWEHNRGFADARVLMLEQPYQQKKEIGVVYTCLGENSGTLLMKDNHRRVYVADIKTGVMHEVAGNWPRTCNLRRSKTVPLGTDWPTLFLSRLGVAT